MKKIILGTIFVLFFLFTIGNAKINKISRSKRILTTEDVAFQFIYLGSCSKFFSIPSIIISRKTSDNCLPITAAAPYSDFSTLDADVLCTDTGPNRAQIDFVEIYDPLVGHDTPVSDFIISFATNAPYKASSVGVSYLRRPSCEIDQDYCSTTDYVRSCTENIVQMSNGFVVSKDVVYVIPGGSTFVGCSVAESTCCSYITPGFCPRSADDSVFRLKFKPSHQEKPHHKPHYRPNDEDDERRESSHNEHHENNEKQQHQNNNKQNKAPGRGKHAVKVEDKSAGDKKQEMPKEDKKVQPQPDNGVPMSFDLKAKSKSHPTITAKKVSQEMKPLIPLREVKVAKHADEEDDDEDKKRK